MIGAHCCIKNGLCYLRQCTASALEGGIIGQWPKKCNELLHFLAAHVKKGRRFLHESCRTSRILGAGNIQEQSEELCHGLVDQWIQCAHMYIAKNYCDQDVPCAYTRE